LGTKRPRGRFPLFDCGLSKTKGPRRGRSQSIVRFAGDARSECPQDYAIAAFAQPLQTAHEIRKKA
jgi:hypothetical protein